MQKDERFLLKPWLAYYGYLFGFENLFVFDNGSERPEVRDVLAEYEAKGVNVDRSHSSREDYLAKADIIGERIRALDALAAYDFLIPLDCDEFILLKDDNGYTDSRNAVLAYLGTIADEQRALRFPYQLANHPLHPDIYHYFGFFKSFFTPGTFKSMDHGHHLGESCKADGFRNTNLIQLHFHHKPFDILVEQARRSWIGTVDPDDREALKNYHGRSVHLAKFFLQTREEYYAGFLEKVHFFLPEFRRRLASLGAPLVLPSEHVAKELMITVKAHRPQDISGIGGTTVFIPTKDPEHSFATARFDERLYLAANPDLARPDVEPTHQFCFYGYREGRPLRPRQDAPVTKAAAPLSGTSRTSHVITGYIGGNGQVRPGPDGKRCIELGAGGHARPGWIETDLNEIGHVLALDVTKPFPIPDKSFHFVYSEHMIEHIPFESGQFMLRECYRIMQPGAVIRIVTPSIRFLIGLFSNARSEVEERYIQWATQQFVRSAPRPLPSLVFNNFVRNWGHTFIYDEETLHLALEGAGFADIKACRIGESEHEKLRNLETIDRMPPGFLALESMIMEATRRPTPA